MPNVLITGANKGLGHEAARRLLAAGYDVFLGARDVGRGQSAAAALGATFVAIDVTDDASVAAAVQAVQRRAGQLDVLVNNAGISGGMDRPDQMTVRTMQETFGTNVFGIVRVTQAFLPLLRRAKAAVIVNVSSGLGSFATVTDTARIEAKVLAAHYCASKAAVNMLTLQYARALPSMRINAVDPGYTATDLNGHSGPQTVTEGTDAIVHMAMLGPEGPTGTLVDRHGPRPW